MGMVMGYTEDYDCPECASRQRARVLGMRSGGQRVETLQCTTCNTTWEPGSDQGERQDRDLDHTPGERPFG